MKDNINIQKDKDIVIEYIKGELTFLSNHIGELNHRIKDIENKAKNHLNLNLEYKCCGCGNYVNPSTMAFMFNGGLIMHVQCWKDKKFPLDFESVK